MSPSPAVSKSRHPVAGVVLALISVAAALPAQAQTLYDTLRSCKVVGFVGAHADDEIFVAPLFAHLCRDPNPVPGSGGMLRQCHMITLTRGQDNCTTPYCQSQCPGGSPSCVAALRLQELMASAALLGSDVERFDYDAMGQAPSWEVAIGRWITQKHETVQDLLDKVVASFERDPDAGKPPVDCLLALDYRHGSTCHEEHMAASAVALVAARSLSAPVAVEKIFLSQAHYVPYLQTTPGFQWCGYQGAPIVDPLEAPLIDLYDATVLGPWGEGGGSIQSWGFLPAVVRSHPSQFGPRAACMVQGAAAVDRIVPFLRWDLVNVGATAYAQSCSSPPPIGVGGSCSAALLASCS